jgi:hypothetical protein
VLPTRPDDREKVKAGDLVRLCNCNEDLDEVCIKIHPRGLFLRHSRDPHNTQNSLFDSWVLYAFGRECHYLSMNPIRIINEGG